MLPATFYIIDMDGTTLDSKGDWSEKSLIEANLRNLDKLQQIAKLKIGKQGNYFQIFGVIYTGRDVIQMRQIAKLFLQKRFRFNTIIARHWELPNPMNENRFYKRYWSDKLEYALSLIELQTTVTKVEFWEDDTVICEMARRCKFNCVQFQECKIIREDRF